MEAGGGLGESKALGRQLASGGQFAVRRPSGARGGVGEGPAGTGYGGSRPHLSPVGHLPSVPLVWRLRGGARTRMSHLHNREAPGGPMVSEPTFFLARAGASKRYFCL